MPTTAFDFRFSPAFRLAGLPFGVMPATTSVQVDGTRLLARFGPWRVETDLSNVTGSEITGPYGFIKTAGPAHLSFTDRGLTFATNRHRGLCIRFAEPVGGIEPTGRLRHPGLTVTVVDPEGLALALGP
jgi:hypothetical protein